MAFERYHQVDLNGIRDGYGLTRRGSDCNTKTHETGLACWGQAAGSIVGFGM